MRALLPQVTAAILHDRCVRTRSQARGCVVTFGAHRLHGEKAFGCWGRRVLNAIAKDAVYADCPGGAPPQDHREEPRPGAGMPPADADRVERAGWYGHLRRRYDKVVEWCDGDGSPVRVWTDGSGGKEGRSAGAGVFYGRNNPCNRALRVPGRQTCARAELYAALHVLRTEQRAVSVRSDCRYVVDGILTWRHDWRANAWYDKPQQGRLIEHADLWREVDRLLALRTAPFEVRWTKGHPLPRHLAPGLTTELDAWGNVGADYLAGVASSTEDSGVLARAQVAAQCPAAAAA